MKSIGILSYLVEKGKIHFWWKRVTPGGPAQTNLSYSK
jgi:hypothetical protein